MGRLDILFQAQSGRVGIQIQSSAKHEHVQVSPFISHCLHFPVSNWKIFTQKLCKKEIVVRVSLLDTNIQAPGRKKAPGRSAKESRHELKNFSCLLYVSAYYRSSFLQAPFNFKGFQSIFHKALQSKLLVPDYYLSMVTGYL